mmetsp:Transcript_13868/g.30231  ORF Transcript_13868/g.30231 Transcript_13868/m.30231 type:complete len:113 (+) Transcript_13868:1333-1671(+)
MVRLVLAEIPPFCLRVPSLRNVGIVLAFCIVSIFLGRYRLKPQHKRKLWRCWSNFDRASFFRVDGRDDDFERNQLLDGGGGGWYGLVLVVLVCGGGFFSVAGRFVGIWFSYM